MNSTKTLIKLGAGLTNNNYHLSIDKGMEGPNKAIYYSKKVLHHLIFTKFLSNVLNKYTKHIF